MAMNATTLKTAILAAIDGLTDEELADRDAFWQAVCDTLITHITTNAVITVPVTGTDVGLQSYSTGGPPVATTGPLIATSLDGSIA
jgi:bisphosphoglycerate-independent phosphoglycerate mutase (AlkP superfamily)